MKQVIAKFNGKYKTQRDNVKAYYLVGDNFVDDKGKVLFAAKDIDKYEHKLFNRFNECFISTGAMFTEALYNAGIITTPIDELAYKIAVEAGTKGSETRFSWSAHEKFIDKIIAGTAYEFYTLKSKPNIDRIVESINTGFPVMASIWLKPWYLGEGHLTLIVGYKTNEQGDLQGFIVNDPFGDCLKKYKEKDGEKVYYPLDDFKKMLSSPEDQPRFMGIIRKK